MKIPALISLLVFPGGLFLIFGGMIYEWVDRKMVARYQNRIGPRWFQPLADVVKLLSKRKSYRRALTRTCSSFCP